METNSKDNHLQIFLNRVDTLVSEGSEMKHTSTEPEVEECYEDAQLKSILNTLGIDYSELLRLKSVYHLHGDDQCLHCKLIEQISSIQGEIDNLHREVSATQEILKSKKLRNNEFKGVIDKLQGNFGKIAEDETIIESTHKTCSCNQRCLVF